MLFINIPITAKFNYYSYIGIMNDRSDNSLNDNEKLKDESSANIADNLADYIKDVHRQLRTSTKNVTDGEVKIKWQEHLENKMCLQKYGESMHNLATNHWIQSGTESRITWCHQAIKSYFKDVIHKKTDKEARKLSFCKNNEIEAFNDLRKCLPAYDDSQPLKVLDVGSCYNPFGSFEDLDVTAIDLSPVNPEVYKCDFISLKVVESTSATNSGLLQSNSHFGVKENVDTTLQSTSVSKRLIDDASNEAQPNKKQRLNSSLTAVITELKAASFDVVIFCLFLEYIPSPEWRFQCCKKAYDLLLLNGVLCIITPDSKSVTTNGYLCKLWQISLGHLGFDRVLYEKRAHFHGMVFRKGLCSSVWKEDSKRRLEQFKNKDYAEQLCDIIYEEILRRIYIISEIREMRNLKK